MKTQSFKAIALFLMIPLIITAAEGQSLDYSNAVVNFNAAGYWPMHETEAAAAGDIETNYGTLGILGNAYYGDWVTNNGAFVHQMAGPLVNGADSGVYFKQPISNAGAATNSLIVPHTSPLTTLTAPFTVEMWYMITNLPSPGFQNDILSQCNANKDQGFRIYYQDSSGGVASNGAAYNVLFYNTTTVNQGFQVSWGGAPTNQWHYMVMVVTTNSNVYTYLDGILQTAAGADPRQIPAGRYSPDTHDPLTIGNGLGNLRGFNGMISEVAIYTNALSTNDINLHYSDATNALASASQYYNDVIADNPTIYLRMNSPSYSAPDPGNWPVAFNYGQTNGIAIGNAIYTPGTVPGGVAATVYTNFPGYPFGLIGTNVAPLSGVSSFVDAGNAPVYNPTGTTPFTVTAMFRGNPTDTNRVQSIIGHGVNSWELGVTMGGFLVFNSGTNSTAAVATGVGAGDLVSTAPNYDDGAWHQVVAVHNGATNVLYVDGIANNTNIVNANNVGNSLDVMIGSDPSYTNNPVALGRQFAGQICDAAFFTNALTPLQVQTLYNKSDIPPTIAQQPVSAAVGAGSAFTNTVVLAGGTQPLSIQWYTNGVPVSGQTNLSLVFNPVLPVDASTDYYLVVTNSSGSVTSKVVSLTVYSSIVFTGQFPTTYTNPMVLYAGKSVGGTNYLGSTPSFSVSAVGGVPLSYQWYTNGIVVGGATNTSFTITNCQLSSPTNFYCIVSNNYGAVTSSVWSASYLAAPMAPFPQAVLAAGPVGYWRLNEAPGPDNGNPGDAGIICDDYQSGNNGVYTNVDLGYNFSYNETTDPSETSAYFGYDAGSGCFAGMIGTNIDFARPAGVNGEFTIALWANGQSILQNGNAGMVTKGYFYGEELNLDNGGPGNTVRFEVRDAAGGDHDATNTFNLGNDSNWHFIAGVCDEANSNITLYVDGRPAGRASISPGGGITNSTSVPLMIGARSSNSGTHGNNQYQGLLNDVAVYNYALSPGQITGQYGVVGNSVAPYFSPAPSTNASAGINKTLTIPVTAVGTPPIGYIWTNVTAGSTVAAGTANTTSLNATLSYGNVPASWNGNQLELIVTNAVGATNAFFTLSLTNTINLSPTNIVFSVAAGNQLNLSWPSDHIGWVLQAQTNSLSVGISNNWYNVANSTSTNQLAIPINTSNGAVFYRLVYP